jgi:hypothetical protein
VTSFQAAVNAVALQDGGRASYDYLIIAVGIKLNWYGIRGMSAEQVGRDGICSNYLYDRCEGTWSTLREVAGGTALFTNSPPRSNAHRPIKCAGAPQKIMYLADDHFRRSAWGAGPQPDRVRVRRAGDLRLPAVYWHGVLKGLDWPPHFSRQVTTARAQPPVGLVLNLRVVCFYSWKL